MHFDLHLGNEHHEIYLASEGATVEVEVDGEIVEAQLEGEPGDLQVTIGDRSFHVETRGDEVRVDGATFPLELRNFRPGEAPGEHGPGAVEGQAIVPPMPGTVVELKVAEGDEVEQGDVLLILEAMKMQNEISAPNAGTVKAIHVAEGDNVEAKDLLVELD